MFDLHTLYVEDLRTHIAIAPYASRCPRTWGLNIVKNESAACEVEEAGKLSGAHEESALARA
jgi:hypothetical protein